MLCSLNKYALLVSESRACFTVNCCSGLCLSIHDSPSSKEPSAPYGVYVGLILVFITLCLVYFYGDRYTQKQTHTIDPEHTHSEYTL